VRGTEANELLTSTTAALLIALLAVEGITIIALGQLLGLHMFVGLALVPPVLLKLGSTGYRFARYYLGARAYREKGPPHLVLRLLAPLLVVATLTVLGTGIWLLLLGRRSDGVLQVHKIAFIVWGVVFVIHLLAHAPRMARALGRAWGARRRMPVPGARAAALMMLAALAAGIAIGLVALSAINGWHRGGQGRDEGRAPLAGLRAAADADGPGHGMPFGNGSTRASRRSSSAPELGPQRLPTL
jgi:hypothetical protein